MLSEKGVHAILKKKACCSYMACSINSVLCGVLKHCEQAIHITIMTTHESENSLDFLGKLLENTKITQKFSASFGKGISTGAI